MNTTTVGRRAEAVAASFLERHNFVVLKHNWRTRYCEIDIIAKRGTTIYFVEVKYRHSNSFGDGIEHITPTKLHQMQFAARLWLARHGWQRSARLMAVSVGPNGVQRALIL